jgi:hypothetical protein
MILSAWKSALFGFLLSSALVITACAAFYFSAERASTLTDDMNFRAEFADELRWHARTLGELLVAASACYWFISALYGRGNILAVRWANYPLIAAFVLSMLLLSNPFYWNINTYCDVIIRGQTSFSIFKLTECPNSGIVFNALQTLTFLLASHSLLFRIIKSRNTENLSS